MKTLLSLAALSAWTGQPCQGTDRHEKISGARMMMCDLLWSGRVAVAVLVLSGCASLEEPRPTDRTAVVKAGQWGEIYRGGHAEMVSVNGVQPSWRLRSEIEVGAGDQTGLFYVYLCNGGSKPCNNSIAEAQISFRAEGGHTYRVHAREQVNGSNRFWVWVEDEGTGKVVGGATPRSSP
jgi:hypothetical protein